MAGVLRTPRVSASASFYLRKLRTFLYGIFSGQANRHSLAFWDETMVTLPLAPLHRPTPNWTGQEGMQRGSHLRPPFPCSTKHREHTSELVNIHTHTLTHTQRPQQSGGGTTQRLRFTTRTSCCTTTSACARMGSRTSTALTTSTRLLVTRLWRYAIRSVGHLATVAAHALAV